MATIVFSAVGTAIGGPIGGAIGALVGRQVDGALFGIPNRRGPRLKELDIMTSTYGQVLPRHFGRMRVSGSVIWATDLVEHSETQGGGKGSPSVTSYSYTVSFAVALSSRPIKSIGRIWADGKLLRGEDGNMKVGGTMRLYTGHGDQAPDGLLVSAEGAARCPAYRGLAYVVFEDLDLSDFFNRVPNLTFEVIADDEFDLSTLIGGAVEDIDAAVSLEKLAGFTCDGPIADTLQVIDEVVPIEVHSSGDTLYIGPAHAQTSVPVLAEPAIGREDGDFGAAAGYIRQRDTAIDRIPTALRYYDTDRDFLPGLQRATGRAADGEPITVELPAAIAASAARELIEQRARRGDWSRDRISWRTTQLDLNVSPGALVAVPEVRGLWRVSEWEWRATGVELSLARVFPAAGDPAISPAAAAGRIAPQIDLPIGQTVIEAFELPFLTPPATGAGAQIFAAVSSSSPNWSGAALYVDQGDGVLRPAGTSGRARSIQGQAASVLAPAHPLLPDRASSVQVQLTGSDMHFVGASTEQLARGANLALLGEEVIQFAQATDLGGGLWELSGLLRGRLGTEAAVSAHAPGERFVLLETALASINAQLLGSAAERKVLALGRGDMEPVVAEVGLPGVSLRPPRPVHRRRETLADGSLRLSWTRRARGGWLWQDGVEVPLVEGTERYLVTLGDFDRPIRMWWTGSPVFDLPPSLLAELSSLAPGATLAVRQEGAEAMSDPLPLHTIV